MDWLYDTWEALKVEAVGLVVGSIITYFIYRAAKRTKPIDTGDGFVLRIPTVLWYLAILLLLMVFGILVGDGYSSFQRAGFFILPEPVMFYICVPLFLLAIFGIVYFRNHEIIIGEDSIASYGLFRNRTEILWKEITKVNFSQSAFFLYAHKKRIDVVTLLAGFDTFLEILKEKVPEQVSEEALKKYELFLKRS